MSATTTSDDHAIFPRRVTPIGAFFAAVPAAIVICAAFAMISVSLPVILMLILVAAMGTCLVLLKTAVEDMGDVKIEWSNQALVVHRVTGVSEFPWSHVDHVMLFDPGATFGDLGRHDEKRAAIGIYLRNPERKERPEIPDVMLVSRDGEAADKIPKLHEQLAHAKRYSGGKDARRIGGGPVVSPRQAKAFRRTSKAATAPAA